MKRKFLVSIICLSLFSSCEKLLEINPKQSIDSSIALTSTEGISAALTSVYARLQHYTLYGRDYLALAEALSDNMVHTDNSSHLRPEATNTRNAHLSGWQMSYYAINQANLIIDALNNGTYETSWKANTLGQAYFLRALCYHDLMRAYAYDPTAIVDAYNYGGVPLMLVGVDDVGKIAALERPALEKVYDQIYADLDLAHTNLASSNSTSVHLATKAAVSALYARVALYRGDYGKTVEMATQALGETNAVFSSQANFLADWRKEVHPESIFELKFNISENIGSDRSLRSTYTSRATYDATDFSIQAVLAVDPAFYTSYSNDDVRRGLIRPGVGKNERFLENYKFISKSGTLGLDNVPILRLSEVYLNRAEALARQHTPDGNTAMQDLNKIRNRAGLPSVTLAGEPLINEIMLQRRLELAFEGHRWFDLKRTGKDIVKGSGTIAFTDYRILAPIPIRETIADPILKQNFNY